MWVLIIFFWSFSFDGGVSAVHIEGFNSKSKCETAGETIKAQKFSYPNPTSLVAGNVNVQYVCINK